MADRSEADRYNASDAVRTESLITQGKNINHMSVQINHLYRDPERNDSMERLYEILEEMQPEVPDR